MQKQAYNFGYMCGKHIQFTTQFSGMTAEFIDAYMDGFEAGFREFLANRLLVNLRD